MADIFRDFFQFYQTRPLLYLRFGHDVFSRTFFPVHCLLVMLLLDQGCTDFTKMWEPIQIPELSSCDVKQFPFRGPTNSKCHRATFSRPGDLASRILPPLD
jgi:hypothetical protein